jgi:hypothetical protein
LIPYIIDIDTTEIYTVVNDSLITASDYFPLKNSFSEDELDSNYIYGKLNYAGQLKDYLRYHHIDNPSPFSSLSYFHSYLSGFGTISWHDRNLNKYFEDFKSIKLVKYNDIIINPDSLDTLMINSVAIQSHYLTKKSQYIKSVQELLIELSLCNKQNYEINLYSINGRKIESILGYNHLKKLLNKIPTGIYIISGILNNRPFCFKQSMLK